MDSDDEWEEEEPGESLSNSEVHFLALRILLPQSNAFCNFILISVFIKMEGNGRRVKANRWNV